MGQRSVIYQEEIIFNDQEKKAILWSLKYLAESDGIRSNLKADTLGKFFLVLGFNVSADSLKELSEMDKTEVFAILKGLSLNYKHHVKKLLEGFALIDGTINKKERKVLVEIENSCDL